MKKSADGLALQTKHLIRGEKGRILKVSPKFLGKREAQVKYHVAEANGDWLKKTQAWLYGLVNST